jgi:hypothetical protein
MAAFAWCTWLLLNLAPPAQELSVDICAAK